jgi:hypothetical protein
VSPSPSPTDVVEAQLLGLAAEVTRIDSEIEALKVRREGIEMMQDALKKLVPKRPTNGVTITPGTGDFKLVGQAAALMVGRGRRGGNPNGTGFREAVRRVLRDHPKGLKPAEVVAELQKRGDLALYMGKTKIGARIQNELYAMKRAGHVSRSYERYALTNKEVNAA